MTPNTWGLIGMLVGAGIVLVAYAVVVWSQKR